MSQLLWLAHFAEQQQSSVDAEHQRITKKLKERWHVDEKVVALLVVFEWHVVDDLDALPASARRVAAAARGVGWRVRAVEALACDPCRGVIKSLTVRFARHDEAGFAAWHNGHFAHAWLVGVRGIEKLASRRTARARSIADALEGVGHLDKLVMGH